MALVQTCPLFRKAAQAAARGRGSLADPMVGATVVVAILVVPALRADLAKVLGLPTQRVRVIQPVIEGVVTERRITPDDELELLDRIEGELADEVGLGRDVAGPGEALAQKPRITKILRDLATPLLMLGWYEALVVGVRMPQKDVLKVRYQKTF